MTKQICKSSVGVAPGLPQGSVLSPVLFNIYTSKIAKDDDDGRVLSFADDVTVYVQGGDRLQSTRRLQAKLNDLGDWCEEHNAVINPSKAQVMWCSLDNRIVNDITPPITFNYEIIDRQDELKYLGITFDRTLSYKKHVNNISLKAKKGISAIKTMASAMIPQRILFLMLQ